ncbi:hypothetical protein PRK78_004465 [Emydomyces testavorans]|uniref:DUF7514 domain-containing protein n=1 Tax=Emydomyces testavorans TaxID=2070801 RepID=A0AAF0DI55_9EURO|nr:hypothetical protein PRK78_004465 [Emydomyces testavorans]
MASQESRAPVQWSYVINADKSPTPQLEQLCLGIANAISKLTKSHTWDLTPDKLAAFYQRVGGNYDNIFLSTPSASLSFIYQKLGCFHSLQPICDAFEPPCIPALLPHGFVRWQTIQLLLCPEEHARFLQEAVRQFDIVNPATGEVFPKDIPRSVFPTEPDPEIVQWHDTVSKKLEHDFWANRTGIFPTQSASPDHGPHQHPTNLNDPSGHGASDYFSQRHTSTRSHPDLPPHKASRESSPSFSHLRDRMMPKKSHSNESTEKMAQRRANREPIARENRASQSFRHVRPSPPREHKRGRSCTPSRLRWSQRMTDSSDHSEPSDTEALPFSRQRESRQERLHSPELRGLRRHSHDSGTSHQRRWSRSPHKQQTHAQRAEYHSHHSHHHPREHRYAYVYPDDDDGDADEVVPTNIPPPSPSAFPSARRFSHQDRYPDEPPQRHAYLSRTTSAPAHKPLYRNPSPSPHPMPRRPRHREHYASHPSYSSSEPTSPDISGPVRRQSHSKTPPLGRTYTRYYIPRVDSEPFPPAAATHPWRSSRPGLAGRSRSRGDVERPFTLSSMRYASGLGAGKIYKYEWD